MDLNRDALAAQEAYGRWLAWSTRIALVLLLAAYAAYMVDTFAAHVPIERLPELWGLPAPKFLERTGAQPGWGWVALLPADDMIVLAAIALLVSSSIPCLAAVIPLFRKRGESLFVAICVLQIAVLLLAASGVP
ncbi:MAG TPA: hypothetical protein VE085_12370 [Burkholderiales bacterium]|nr:hypothetical protein [Burkholderiales bacterium]